MLIAPAVLALLSCGGAASTAAPADRGARPSFAVVGIKPGMSSDQVRRILAAAGYTAGHVTPGRTFAEAVVAARGGAAFVHSGIGEEAFAKGDGEAVSVSYLAMPSGPVAYSVTYTVYPGVSSFENVRAELTRRYGAPQQQWPSSSIWCAPANRACPPTQLNMQVTKMVSATYVTIVDATFSDRQAAAIRNQGGAQRPTM